jgi:hypothetical protein
MATMNELVARARLLSGVHSAALAPDPLLLSFANELYAEVNGTLAWPFLAKQASRSLAAGSNALLLSDLAGKVRQIQQVDLTFSGGTRSLERRAIGSVPPQGSTGVPSVYTADTTHLRVFPAPSEAVSLTIAYQPEALTLTGSATPVWPVEYHDAIAYFTAGRVLAVESDDTGRQQDYEQRALAIVERMRRHFFSDVDRTGGWVGGVVDPRSAWRDRGGRL